MPLKHPAAGRKRHTAHVGSLWRINIHTTARKHLLTANILLNRAAYFSNFYAKITCWFIRNHQSRQRV
ncbi:hypothetical protein FKW15_13770 [Acetobacter sp. DmW_125133]|nr:hypothetical protein FKW19_07865 [Acetobacter sp. DmW_125128]KAA8398247.1 hypothetical protein FKW20_07770 [Acetobacter sp. DmW_125127]KAA8401892.1 hypothetical protein FKW15_13770 [Acetobacter sp. DmW_125133]KAA8402289.1 hypothetical protein FKW24_13485 [Acetobacter sp. DmW_125134]KAA8403942.1 hypothetical protein FKW32_09930 [Acetobacter sp. DmW_125132]KAA8419563.1 hypothetical protein FKW25_10880 [Acetobacter sp. DmW_125126]KAA8422598.1 hypothetical protein FKW26_06205 [Acetobacter sp. 